MSRATHTSADSDALAYERSGTSRRRWLALALICVAHFMLVLDVTVVNVALPVISADLHLDREALTWVVTSYTLCFGGLMLLGGRLADAFGARRMMLIGLAVFTAASLSSGFAQTGTALIAGRIGQGVGAAMLSPAALSLVATTFHGQERNRALGVWAALGGIGSAAGVLLGGALTSGPGWVWVFFVNVPVGIAVLITLPLTVSSLPAAKRRSIDLPGGLLVTGATGALIYGLVKAGEGGWAGRTTVVAFTGATVLYGVFTVVERSVRSPLLDIGLFIRRPVLAGAFLMLIATALLIAFFFLISLYLQRVHTYGALKTGLIFLPVAVAIGAGAQLGGRLVGRIGGRLVAAGGLTLAAIGSVLLIGLPGDSNPVRALLPGFLLAAAGIGAVFVAATTTALGHVSVHEAGLASAIVNTFHEVGGSIGVAVASTVAAAGIEASTAIGFSTAFTVAAVAAAASAALALFLIPAGK